MMRSVLPCQDYTIVAMVQEAKEAVLYAAPGVSREVAAVLLDVAGRLGRDRVGVMLDPSPEVIRSGYGDLEGLQLLHKHGVSVHSSVGLRIGFVRADRTALAFTPLSSLIEDRSARDCLMNALRIDTEEADRLTRALLPELSSIFDQIVTPNPAGVSEVSDRRVENWDVFRTEQDIRMNPPVAPDLARRLRVLNSRFQFVEVTFKGCKLSQRKFSLKATDIGVDAGVAGDNLSGAWRVIGSNLDNRVSFLEGELKRIRETHLLLLRGFGQIILGEDRPGFDQAMEDLKKAIETERGHLNESIKAQLRESRDRLKKLLVESYSKNPPDKLKRVNMRGELWGKQIENEAESLLDNKYPDVDALLKQMELDWKIFNISEQIINKPGFSEAVEKLFGLELEELVKTEQAIGLKPMVDVWGAND